MVMTMMMMTMMMIMMMIMKIEMEKRLVCVSTGRMGRDNTIPDQVAGMKDLAKQVRTRPPPQHKGHSKADKNQETARHRQLPVADLTLLQITFWDTRHSIET